VGLGGAGFFPLAWVTDRVGSGSGRVGLGIVGRGLESSLMEWLRRIRVNRCLVKAEDMCASPSLSDQLEKLSKDAKFHP
jgi:hypothetical protein